MSFRLSDPLNLETSKGDGQDPAVERRGEGLEQQERQQNHAQEARFEGEAAIGRANSEGSNGGSNSSGGYCSVPHHSSSSGDTRPFFSHHSSSPTTSSPAAFLPELPHADATMTDQNMSDIFGRFPARCGGGGGRGGGGSGAAQHMVVPSFTSRRPQWPFSSTESVPSNECCTSESAAEPSHRCDPNYSFLHPHHQQQQIDLSTRPASPRAVAPLSAARGAPGLLPSNEDRQCAISAQQQGIAYSPAAAVADQDFLPFASTIPNSWNKNLSPASSFGSYPSTQGSNLSFETEFGGGGAPITPEDFDGTLKNKHLSSRAHFSNKCTETPDISEDNDEDHSDGGIEVDPSDNEMSSGPVQVLYSSSALHATTMDEDEDGFSPNNLVTRPPSPVGGGSSFFMDIFSPSHERLPEITNGEHSGSYMQLDTLQNGLGPISNFPDVLRPSVELLDSRSQSPSIPSTPSDIVIDPLSPNVQATAPLDNDGPAFFGAEYDELFVVESNYSHPTASMPSQSSSQSPPTAVVPPAPLAAAVVAASGIMTAVADVGGASPSLTHASPTLSPPPHPPLPPPLPPHVSRTPSLFLPLDVFALDGGSISGEEDEFDDITNHTFEHILALEDIENYNFDFAKFCTHAYYRYRLSYSKFPKLFPAAMDVKNMERPQEVTRADMEENGGDYQGISWEKLGITAEAARVIRRKEYVNYRNIKGIDDENPVSLILSFLFSSFFFSFFELVTSPSRIKGQLWFWINVPLN